MNDETKFDHLPIGEPLSGSMEDIFPWRWWRVTDIESSEEVLLTIAHVTIEQTFNRGTNMKERKPILWFRESEKGLIVNVTIANKMAEMFGKHIPAYSDRRIILHVEQGVYNPQKRERGPALRIKEAPPDPPSTIDQLNRIDELGPQIYNDKATGGWPTKRAEIVNALIAGEQHLELLNAAQAQRVLNGLEKRYASLATGEGQNDDQESLPASSAG